MAIFASPFVLDAATAAPADADFVCDAGWNLDGNRCTRRVRQRTRGCDAGWTSYNSEYCSRVQHYCPAGGYLAGGKCNISYWGSLAQYQPSGRFILQPKSTGYRWVTEVRQARWVNVGAGSTPAPTTSGVGNIVDGVPPHGIFPNGCGIRLVNTWESNRIFQGTVHQHSGYSHDTYIIIDRSNKVAGCASNGGTMYRFYVEDRKIAKTTCYQARIGAPRTCDRLTVITTAQFGQGAGHRVPGS